MQDMQAIDKRSIFHRYFLRKRYANPFQGSPVCICSTAYAEARAVKAIYVKEGLWHALEIIAAPSVTKTFDMP